MHFCQIMTLQTGNDAILFKVFPSSLVGLTLSWFHRLAPNTITFFRCLFEKFVTQYMCLVRWKQCVTNLFHVQMERSESIKNFMKCFGAIILQLDPLSPNTVLHVVKQTICLNTQFFDSLSLHLLVTPCNY